MTNQALDPAEAHATLTRILNAIEEYVYTGEFLPDNAYQVVFAGPCRESFLGMSIDQARSAVWADYVHPADMGVFNTAHEGAHTTGRLDVEYRLVGADGRVRWVRDRGRLRAEHDRRFLDGSVLDVTVVRGAQQALEAARAEAHLMSQTDPLTGVFNRRSLTSCTEALRTTSVGLLSLDIDHFKSVNDLFGHAAGDDVLRAVADRIRETVRRQDTIVRMGGEEFLVVLADVTDDVALRDVAEALRERVARDPVRAGDRETRVTVSIGAARVDPPWEHLDPLLATVDRALYAAKRGGRNRVRLASHDFEIEESLDTESSALRLAEAMATVAGAARQLPAADLRNVSLLSARIARRLVGSPDLNMRCRLAGLLHDIGKIRLPATLLQVSDSPSESEWELVRTHPALGAALIETVPDLQAIAPIVRQHHERFDGHGYPDGLAGDEILLEARIVGAASVWEAMTSDRPHRRTATPNVAIGELTRLGGSELDPDVVAALGSVLASPRATDPASADESAGDPSVM